MTDEQPVWRSAEVIASIFKVQVRTVRMWARRGYITAGAEGYDLREVLDWWDNHRDHRMASLRTRHTVVAQSRVTCEPHSACPETGGPPQTVGPTGHHHDVTYDRSLVAHGTTASLASKPPKREPQPWDDLIHEILHDGVAPDTVRNLTIRLAYLQRLGIAIDKPLIDRMVQVEREDAASRQRPPVVKAAVVYYLRIGHLIKIGQTVDLASRLRAYPPTAVLLATEIGDWDTLEAQRLAQFAATHAHRREWFRPSAELLEHINSLREQPLTPAELAA